jgi:DNA-binding transcriptional LysR family regulator
MRWNDRIGRRIKLSDLHVLLAVAQSGSMAKAAHELSMSHPVVSRSISSLEHTLGVRLLERNARGVELTDYGRAMLGRSNAAFDELRQGVKDIDFLTDPSTGDVRIGTTPPIAASFVSTVIDRLARRYPRIAFHVEVLNGDENRRSLDERRVDLLVHRNFREYFDGRVSFERLFESPYVVAAGLRSPWVKRRRIRLADLVGEPWALPATDNSFGSFVLDAFRASGLDLPRATVVATALEMRATLLKTGRYLSIMPEFWLQLPERHPFIRKLPIELPLVSAPVGIVTLKSRALSPVAQRFIDCAHEVAKSMTRQKT